MPSSLELGIQALQEGQPGRAASFFEFAIKKAPADPALRIMVADAYIQAAEHSRAEPHVRFLIDQTDALYQRGEYELLARARAAKAQIDAALLGTVEPAASGGEDPASAGSTITFEPAGTSPGSPVLAGAALESAGPSARRVVACPWCGRTVLLDAAFAGRCECPWFQPGRGSLLYLTDLQRLCADGRAMLLMRVHQDVFALDGQDVRLRLLDKKALKVDARLTFELDLGHPLIRPDHLLPVLPEQHPTAPFQVDGQFYSFAEMLDRIEIEYPDALCVLSRDIHYHKQLSRHLQPDLRQKADEQLAAGARSYGRCLLSAGMTMEDLLRQVPGWQVLRPIGGGHGRLDAVRMLVRKGLVTDQEAVDAITRGRGKDGLEALLDANAIDKTIANDLDMEIKRRKLPVPLRDDIMERLCRRGVISRVTLVRAGLVVGLVDTEIGQEAESLAGAMGRIPPQELERERELLARKEALRRSERLALGKILVELGFCSRQRVVAALARQIKEDSPLGEMLVRDLAITPEQLTVALCEQEQRLEALIAAPPEPAPVRPPIPAPVVAKPAEKQEAKPAEPADKKRRKGKGSSLPPWGLPLAGAAAAVILVIGGLIWFLGRGAGPREAQVEFPQILAPSVQARESLIKGTWRDASGSLLASADLNAVAREVEAVVLGNTGNPVVLINGAFKRLDEGNIRASLTLARRALEIDPKDPYGHVAMGGIWLASGNDYEAARAFEEAKKLEPRLLIEANLRRDAPAASDSARVARRRVALAVSLVEAATASTPVATP